MYVSSVYRKRVEKSIKSNSTNNILGIKMFVLQNSYKQFNLKTIQCSNVKINLRSLI